MFKCLSVADACKRCCRKSLNKTCFPVAHNDILPDGTPCIQGFCNKGVCEKTIQDVVERIWNIIEDININNVLGFLRDNIVGVAALLLHPASPRKLIHVRLPKQKPTGLKTVIQGTSQL
ncbi:PREDICTED: ADAM 17-like protease [Papilio polytes]|uniref:ADAM 17-like protease n=1 Tax=Papilio polytes TaxID=76194 RepID=UPI0006763C69|nr:PREDICTED: ADAM 17-like protease [Papilio polytes]